MVSSAAARCGSGAVSASLLIGTPQLGLKAGVPLSGEASAIAAAHTKAPRARRRCLAGGGRTAKRGMLMVRPGIFAQDAQLGKVWLRLREPGPPARPLDQRRTSLR